MKRISLPAALLVVVSSFASLAACGGGEPAAKAPSSESAPKADATPSTVKAPGEAKVGDKARCPVSGEEFTVTADSPHAEKDGKTYYFCCASCKGKFEKEPDKYTQAAAH